MTEFVRLQRFLTGLLLLSIASFAAAESDLSPLQELHPDPALTPRDVVSIQMEALMANNDLDEGIELVFRFAAPENQRRTGPLPRFSQMMHSGMYRPMLNAQSVDYQKEFEGKSLAAQTVIVRDLIGAEHHYMFILRKQFQGIYKDCWMTESVLSKPKPPITLPKPA